jgi:beta-lactamase class A
MSVKSSLIERMKSIRERVSDTQREQPTTPAASAPPSLPRFLFAGHTLSRLGLQAVLIAVVLSLLVAYFALAQLRAAPRPAASASQTPVGNAVSAAADAASHVPSGPAMLDLKALSPDLAQYVAGVAATGTDIGVAVYDVTGNRYYSYNQNETFTLASSSKVYILCGYLDMLERQGRSPNSNERAQMYAMITRSDNNAAQWLYNRLGQESGQRSFLQRIGITDYVGRGYDWGWAQLSPASMVHILSLLHTGKLLSDADRAYALGLMGQVDLGRWGVGDQAPDGAQVYMKDGWVTGPDDLWAQNSSGIVVTSGETYIISVYTAHQPRYDWSRVQHVCGAVADILK